MNRDIKSNLEPKIALEPTLINTETTTVGVIIDTADYDGGMVFVLSSNFTSGEFTPLVEHGDDPALSDASAVADDYLIGTEALATIKTDNLVKSIGVVSNGKRYVRLSIVSSLTPNATISAVVLGNKEVLPV